MTKDENFTFKHHVTKVLTKIAVSSSSINNARFSLRSQMKTNLYNALVKPHYEYRCAAWGNAVSVKLKQKLVVAQKRVLISVYLKPFYA